jgi:hypothetical protein
MSNLPSFKERLLTDAIAALNGGKLYFYESGASTTPLTTYSDSALATPHANPVVADANGVFPEIYLQEGVAYRVVLKNSGETTTYFTLDDIYAVQLTSSAFHTQVYETVTNPKRYGGTGTGAADETTYVQQAIDNAVASSRKGVVDLLGRTWRCDSALTLPDGVTLRNGKLDFSNNNSAAFITATGTQATSVALSGNVAEGAGTVGVASASGLAVGDLFLISEQVASPPAEIMRIRSISGTTLTLAHHADGAYTTANNGFIKLLTTLKDICIEDVEIVGNPSASGEGTVFRFTTCERVRISNVRVRSLKAAAFAFDFRTCIDVSMEGCVIDTGPTAATGIGVNIGEASCLVKVDRCTFLQLATGLQTGNSSPNAGPVTRSVSVSGCSFDGCTAPVVVGQYSRYVQVAGNDIRDPDAATNVGVNVTGRNVSVLDNDISARAGGSGTGIALGGPSGWTTTIPGGLVVRGNKIVCDDGGISMSTSSGSGGGAVENVAVEGNTIYVTGNGSGDGIKFNLSVGAPDVGNVVIRGNAIYASSTGQDGIDLTASSTPVLERVVVEGNTFLGTTTGWFVKLAGTSLRQVIIANNMAEQTSASSVGFVSAVGVTDLTISGNVFRAATAGSAQAIVINNASVLSTVAIVGNVIRMSSSVILIDIDDVKELTLASNTISRTGGAGTVVINITATSADVSAIAITGNQVSDTGSGQGLKITGGAAAKVLYCSVHGNVWDGPGDRLVWLSGYVETFSICGNALRCPNAGVNGVIEVNGGAAAAMLNGTISGNALRGAAYGIVTSNISKVHQSGNSFHDQATARTSGIAEGTNAAAGDNVW